jgi:hypothetical protein
MQLGRRTAIVGEPPNRPGFRIVTVNARQEIRVPAKRGWRLLPFHSVWEFFWTCGGIAAFYRLIAHPGLWNLAVFCVAILVCTRIIGALAWMATGEEVIRLTPDRLEIGYRLLGFERMRRYSIGNVDGLGTWDDNPALDPAVPFVRPLSHGAVKFETPERRIFCAASLDEMDAKRLVDHLRRRLPAEAREAHPLRQLFW